MADGGWQSNLGWRGWLAAGLAVVVVVIVLIARLGGDDDKDSSSSADGKSSSSGKRSGNDSVVVASSVPPSPEAVNVAKSFMRAWVDHPAGVDDEQWWRKLVPYAESAFAQQLKSTDPSRVPAAQVTGEPAVVSNNANRAVFTVPTDSGPVLVTCVKLNETSGWKVIDLDTESAGPNESPEPK